jgi:hypothetical protein
MIASTCAAASPIGLSWSSMLAPTTANGLRSVAVPALEVGGDREVGRVDDPLDLLEHQVERDVLAVLVAEAGRDRVAGRCDRGGALDGGYRAGAHHVPDVDQRQQRRVLVEAEELGSLALGGVVGGHGPIVPDVPDRAAARPPLGTSGTIPPG